MGPWFTAPCTTERGWHTDTSHPGHLPCQPRATPLHPPAFTDTHPPLPPTTHAGRYPDSWKRRGQARSALGDMPAALADLQRCIELLPTFAGVENVAQSMAECHVERALMYQKVRDWRRAAAELRKATGLDDKNVQVGGWGGGGGGPDAGTPAGGVLATGLHAGRPAAPASTRQ